ncbi:hypothetical protein GCM10008106_29390 [Mongoliitalea lutea]|uniref:DNA-binding beta-propeller fold protein YncE n=2 Tax=Mongoliitalea lutea TaxID=849756 RepID=A0A8J3D0N5_9BACT|nr:hypothetical protein GCM10008106_29390 [Mongoliitalea lutea]
MIYCGPKEQQEVLTINPDTNFLFVSESDSMYLASFQDDLIVVKDATKKEGTASIYLSEDGRLLFSMERTEGHINIMELSRFGKWLPKHIARPQPTHWTGVNNHSLIFNDGDGSVIYVKADQSSIEGFTLGILELEESVAHHGAALYLNNDAVAMTVKSEDEEGALPKRVALVDIKSQQILLTTDDVSLDGIHGAQSNGVYAVFGSTDGILWIKNDQSYGLLAYPQPLENSSGNWIGTIKGAADTFVGSSRNHGLFKLDLKAKTIQILYSSDQIVDYQISKDGRFTAVMLKDNRLAVLDNESLNLQAEISIPNQPETPKGFKMAIHENFLFVASLGYNQFQVLELATLNPLKQFYTNVALSDFKVF